jgi:hypothetical protein
LPKPISPQAREAIIADIRAGKARNQIARDHHVSAGSVTNIAQQAGITDAFDRSATVKGTRAKQFDAKAARAKLIVDLLGDAQRFRERAWSQYTQIVSGPAGAELVTTKLPPLRDQQSAYTSVAICIDKSVRLEQADQGDGSAAARSLLGQLGEALQVAAASLPPEDGAAAGG